MPNYVLFSTNSFLKEVTRAAGDAVKPKKASITETCKAL
jgi:hypothetical protein